MIWTVLDLGDISLVHSTVIVKIIYSTLIPNEQTLTLVIKFEFCDNSEGLF